MVYRYEALERTEAILALLTLRSASCKEMGRSSKCQSLFQAHCCPLIWWAVLTTSLSWAPSYKRRNCMQGGQEVEGSTKGNDGRASSALKAKADLMQIRVDHTHIFLWQENCTTARKTRDRGNCLIRRVVVRHVCRGHNSKPANLPRTDALHNGVEAATATPSSHREIGARRAAEG